MLISHDNSYRFIQQVGVLLKALEPFRESASQAITFSLSSSSHNLMGVQQTDSVGLNHSTHLKFYKSKPHFTSKRTTTTSIATTCSYGHTFVSSITRILGFREKWCRHYIEIEINETGFHRYLHSYCWFFLKSPSTMSLFAYVEKGD